jgi:type IV secretion system protein VirB10
MAEDIIEVEPLPPPARKLNKKLIIAIVVILTGLFSVFSLSSFRKNNPKDSAKPRPAKTASSRINLESLLSLPSSYAQLKDQTPQPVVTPAAAASKPAVLKRIPPGMPPKVNQTRSRAETERDRALRSKILFTGIRPRRKLGEKPAAEDPYNRLAAFRNKSGQAAADSETRIAQRSKQAFLKEAEGVDTAVYLNRRLQEPVSRYQVMAGSVLPAVLITGINSDLPGQIIAQIRENIFDTVTGNYLLIPQGTKLLGRYDNMIAWGQERVLLIWSRLVFPDGSSILLDKMPGVDQAGYAGLKDRVNNHYAKLAGAILMSTFLSVGAVRSQGDIEGDYPSVSQEIARQLAADINRTGQKIVRKQLNVPPTIEVRPGWTFHVMVNRDMILRPYAG